MLIYIDNYKYARNMSVFSSGYNINTIKVGYWCDKDSAKNALRIFVKSK